jgi:queuine/archaeosine tRNA-ribosyltransferase
LHNLRFYLDFMSHLRQAIELGTLSEPTVFDPPPNADSP